jgi:Flp pilus assembly protein TadD
MQLFPGNRGALVVAGGRPRGRRRDLTIGDLAPAAIALSLTLMGCSNLMQTGTNAPPQGHLTVQVADAALAAGAPDVALRVADLILRDAPRDVPALVARGDALYAMGHLDLARGAYRSAVAVDPGSVNALVGLGRTLVRSNPKAAEAAFLDAATRQPDNVPALSNLGIARDLQGRHEDAQAAYRKALAVAPDSTDITVNLGLSLALSGKSAEAVALLRPLAGEADATGLRRKDLAAALALAGDPAASQRVLHGEAAPAGADWPADTASAETPLVAVASPVRGREAAPDVGSSAPVAADAAPLPRLPANAVPAASMPPPSTTTVLASLPLNIETAPVVPVVEMIGAGTMDGAATAAPSAPVPGQAVRPSVATPRVARVAPRHDGGPVKLAAARTAKPTAPVHPAIAHGSGGPAEAVPDSPTAPAAATGAIAVAAPAESGPSSHPGERFCQLAALDSEERARSEWQHLLGQIPDLLSGRTPTIMPADVHGRTFWRLRTGGFHTATEQSAFCSQVHGLGLDCW